MKKSNIYDCPKCGKELFARIAIVIKENPSKEDKICPVPSGGFLAFNDLGYHCELCGFFTEKLEKAEGI